MTPRHRWRRTNRPQTPRNSPPGRGFPAISREYGVKKIARRFERWARVLRLINVGAVIPPHRLYSARAPIHPKRPIWLDPSGCPPGRVFHFRQMFPKKPRSMRCHANRRPHAFRLLFTILPCVFASDIPARASQRGHAAAPLDGGWSRQLRICAGIFDRRALP